MKKFLKIILGEHNFNILRVFLNEKIMKYYFRKSFLRDFKKFNEHSTFFKKDNFNKVETHIILLYHSLEKGFLHKNLRLGFAKDKVKELLSYLNDENVSNHLMRSQISAACMCLMKYYQLHKEKSFDISAYYSIDDYNFIKKFALKNQSPVIEKSSSNFFKKSKSDFLNFSSSRSSVRHYNGEIIPDEIMHDVISIAKNAPSVCNRQGTKVYLLNKAEHIEKILNIQGGLKGFMQNINQVLVVTGNRNGFYEIGERNQLFVDGGLFLMNLLYGLHYNNIAACPAHWCYEDSADDQVREILGMSQSEKIICLITIGKPEDDFKITLSHRRDNSEILSIIN